MGCNPNKKRNTSDKTSASSVEPQRLSAVASTLRPLGTAEDGSAKAEATGYKRIAIIGDGGMATVMAMLLCDKGIATKMWGYDSRQLADIEKRHENKKFLPGYKLPDTLVFEPDDERIMAGADLIVSAVPCQYMRSVWSRLKSYVPEDVPIVTVAKGIENDTLLRPTQIIADVLGKERGTRDEPRPSTDGRDERRDMLFFPARPSPMSWPESSLLLPVPLAAMSR